MFNHNESYVIAPLGKSVPAKRRSTLAKWLLQHGATVIEPTEESHALTTSVSVLVADELLRLPNWRARVKERTGFSGDDCRFVRLSFLTDCIETGTRPSIDEYEAKTPPPEVKSPPVLVHIDEGEVHEIASEEESPIAKEEQAEISPLAKKETGERAALLAAMKLETQMEATTIKKESMNRDLEAALREMSNMYGNMRNEPWRQKTYRIAADIVKRLPYEIQNNSDLDRKELRRIGPRTREKIKEWMVTGTMSKRETIEKDEKYQVVQLFSAIWGVGVANAEKFYSMGLRTLDDLRARTDLLETNQKIGLQYFEDFNERMPREEVEQILARVEEATRRHLPESLVSIVPAGSYRRGAETCGDCDILMFKESEDGLSGELTTILDELHQSGFLTNDLLRPSMESRRVCQTYYGVCHLNSESRHRRIDIKMYAGHLKPYAILHFTGCEYFNRAMRYRAGLLGYSLGDKGMYKVVRRGKEKIPAGPMIICEAEEDIFRVLGMRYVPPTERLTGDISGLILEPRRLLRRKRRKSPSFSEQSETQ